MAVANANAALNGVAAFAKAVVSRGVESRALREGAPYDLVFANILAKPLRLLAPSLARVMAPDGEAIVSGLLLADVAGVVVGLGRARLPPARAHRAGGLGEPAADAVKRRSRTRSATTRPSGSGVRPFGRARPNSGSSIASGRLEPQARPLAGAAHDDAGETPSAGELDHDLLAHARRLAAEQAEAVARNVVDISRHSSAWQDEHAGVPHPRTRGAAMLAQKRHLDLASAIYPA